MGRSQTVDQLRYRLSQIDRRIVRLQRQIRSLQITRDRLRTEVDRKVADGGS